MTTEDRHAWIDASAGVAGDMLLGALLDAGASLTAVQEAVDAVIPGSVQVGVAEVDRAGLRATKAELTLTAADQPHRSWRDVRGLLTDATLTSSVRARATAVFARLAEAEGAVHGIAAEDVHFHEVGALDSIADIVGVCAAIADLGIASVSAGPVAVGAGRVTMAHGEVGVPVPAVVELARGWRVRSGGSGELATPTGMALVVELAGACEDLPELLVSVSGSGAGSRDFPDRANVTRVVIGYQRPDLSAPDLEPAVLLEANVDDLDPRLWPGVLSGLLAAGASDAWLVPIVMKKGRPAHVLSVLCPPTAVVAMRDLIFAETSTFGLREHVVRKHMLSRGWAEVEVDGVPVMVKIAHRDGVIVQATPEFDWVVAAATRLNRPPHAMLSDAAVAAAEAGLRQGAPVDPASRHFGSDAPSEPPKM